MITRERGIKIKLVQNLKLKVMTGKRIKKDSLGLYPKDDNRER
jgi:hypothetical protein